MAGVFTATPSDADTPEEELSRALQIVERFAREACPDGACPIEPVLDRCVHEAVSGLWQTSRITRYVPMLALNQVRDCILAGTCEPRTTAP